MAVIHLDTIHRLAHLAPVFQGTVDSRVTCDNALDAYKVFYVNKFADTHSHQLLYEPHCLDGDSAPGTS